MSASQQGRGSSRTPPEAHRNRAPSQGKAFPFVQIPGGQEVSSQDSSSLNYGGAQDVSISGLAPGQRAPWEQNPQYIPPNRNRGGGGASSSSQPDPGAERTVRSLMQQFNEAERRSHRTQPPVPHAAVINQHPLRPDIRGQSSNEGSLRSGGGWVCCAVSCPI